jgi:hypothetical protein
MVEREYDQLIDGGRLQADRAFIKAIMNEYPVAAHEAYSNASVLVQTDPDVAQTYLESTHASLMTLSLRGHQENRRRAHNDYPPEAEAVLDELLKRFEYYTDTLGLTGTQAFESMRGERTPAMQSAFDAVPLPLLDL